jgi:hypothetical protein
MDNTFYLTLLIMVSFAFSNLLGVFVVLSGLLRKPPSLPDMAPSARPTPAAPHFVIYSDKWVSGETGPPAVSSIEVCIHQRLHYYVSITFLLFGNQGYNVL